MSNYIKPPFTCPNCNAPSDLPTDCPSCRVPLCDTSVLPAWGTTPGFFTQRNAFFGQSPYATYAYPSASRRSALGYAVRPRLAIFRFALGIVASYGAVVNTNELSTDCAVAAAVLFAGALAPLLRRVPRLLAIRALRDRATPALDGAPIATGMVRVRGTIRRTTLTYTPTGTPCVAFDCARAVAGTIEHFSAGATFDLVLDDGRTLAVSAEWVHVAQGRFDRIASVVCDGDRAEVCGRVEYRDGEPSTVTYRGAPHVLAMVGTETDPVFVERLVA